MHSLVYSWLHSVQFSPHQLSFSNSFIQSFILTMFISPPLLKDTKDNAKALTDKIKGVCKQDIRKDIYKTQYCFFRHCITGHS